MTIRAKLNLSVIALLIVFLVAGAFSIHAVAQNAEQTRFYVSMRERAQFTADIRTLLYAQVASAAAPGRLPEATGRSEWARAALDDVDIQIRLSDSPREQKLWRSVRERIRELDAALADPSSGPPVTEIVHSTERSLRELRNHYDVAQYDSVAAAARTSLAAQMTIAAACLLTVLLFLAYLVMVRTWLVRPIEVLKAAADAIGDGNLAHRVPLTGQNELADLARRIDLMATRLAEHQSALVEARELSAIGEICANVAHGLRNPLAAIRTSAQLGARRSNGSDAVRTSFSQLSLQADLMDQRITQLFQFSRPLALRKTPTPTRDVLAAVRAQVQPLLDARALTLVLDDQTADALWLLDREQIADALAELVTNAAHHSPPDGTITVQARVAAEGNPNSRDLVLDVVDEGPGMSPATLHKAFDLFFTSRPGGTGMGLALVRRAVEKHGGTVSITSAPGQGTTVTVRVR